jgi:Skp family chaperone for outer membrane proteins
MPYVNVTKSETGSNAGSCGTLVAYLEKENQGKAWNEKELWFDQQRDNIAPEEVRQRIDGNVAKLKKSEAKFFLVNISPSEKELAHLGQDPVKLKAYARQVMEHYAQNFNKGMEGKDLLYFGKVEWNRSYKYTDQAVRQGEAIRGDLKPGNQMHVQIIVSRKDESNMRLLSPLNNSSGRNASHSQKFGQYNQVNFKQNCEQGFDQQFGYVRKLEEGFAYRNTMQNGSVSDQANLILATRERDRQQAQQQALALQQAQEARKRDLERQQAVELKRQEEKLKLDQAQKEPIKPQIRPSKGIGR